MRLLGSTPYVSSMTRMRIPPLRGVEYEYATVEPYKQAASENMFIMVNLYETYRRNAC